MKRFIIIFLVFFSFRFCRAAYDINYVFVQGDSTLMNMRIESSYFAKGAFLIETTGARFEFVKDNIKIYQGLDKSNRRLLATLFFENEPNFIKVESNEDHILFWSQNINLGIYGDSTCIIAPKENIEVKFKGNFKPDYEGRYEGELLLIDDLGGMEIYPQRYEAGYKIKRIELGKKDWVAEYLLSANERVMIAAFPGKEFDWEKSFRTRIIITHGSMGLGEGNIYGQMPPNSAIKKWSENFDILVLFYKGLYKRPGGDRKKLVSRGPYQIENEPEFKRLMQEAHVNGLKVAVYCSFFSYYRKYHNIEPFYNQIELLKEKFNIDGVYIDGLSFDYWHSKDNNRILNWELIRRFRKLFGPGGVIILHGTHGAQHGNPVATVPNVDCYCNATLNGEGVAFSSVNDPYVYYQIRKYGISNTVGMWRSDGKHPKEISYRGIVDAVIKMNGREHAYASVPLYNPPGPRGYVWGNGMNDRYKYYLEKINAFRKNLSKGKITTK